MLEDPSALTSSNWNDIHIWLTLLWTYVPLLLTFALSILTAHAIIPSLVNTGHLPASANRIKLPLTGFGFLAIIAAVVLMIFAIDRALSIERFWDRWLI
jgi:hypothetical protein